MYALSVLKFLITNSNMVRNIARNTWLLGGSSVAVLCTKLPVATTTSIHSDPKNSVFY
jgi:hypothetical protein